MNFEVNLLTSVLKLTQSQNALIKDVKNDSKLPVSTTMILLEKLQSEETVYIEGESVKIDSKNRLKLAIKAVSLGADIERISKLLSWIEFEDMAVMALENNHFSVEKNVRFKSSDRRWEIDAVGCKKPLVICIDCKHWQHAISPSVKARIVNAQTSRAKALSEASPNASIKLDYQKWTCAKFMPAVLSLIPSNSKFYNNVPIVPILQFQDFLDQLPAYVDMLKIFYKTFSHLG